MQTIGFYSFKGGVGRTNLVMNMAYYLAREQGACVGLMDLDLEAPGLSVAPPLRPVANASGSLEVPDQGIVDFLKRFVENQDNILNIVDIFYETQLGHANTNGSIFLAPALSIAGESSAQKPLLNGLQPRHGEIYQWLTQASPKTSSIPKIGEQIFDVMVKKIEAGLYRTTKNNQEKQRPFDYLLVDLRTGMTELLDISVGHLFDRLVIVSGLNTQNETGLFLALERLKEKLEQAPEQTLVITPVFSPIPNAEIHTTRRKLLTLHNKMFKFRQQLPVALQRRMKLQQLGGDGFDENSVFKFASMPLIHYCDYLALSDDEVLLETYPELLTTQDLENIGEHLFGDVETTQEDIQKDIQRIAPVEEASSVLKQSVSPRLQEWTFNLWEVPLPWDWPIQLFSSNPEIDRQTFLQTYSVPTLTPELEKLLTGLAMSISSPLKEKKRILSSLKEMTLQRQQELSITFMEEQRRFASTSPTNVGRLSNSTFISLKEWKGLLNQHTSFISTLDQIKTIIQSLNSPFSALFPFGVLIEIDSTLDPSLVIPILQEVQPLLSEFPELSLKILDQIPTIDELRDSEFATWFLKAKPWKDTEFSATNWYNLAIDLSQKLYAYGEAEEAYRKASQINSLHAPSWNNLGNLLKNHLGRYEEAEEAYRKASQINSLHAPSWNNLGNLLQEHLGRYEEAEEAYRKASQINPQYASPWHNLGNLLKNRLGRYEEAEKAYRKAIRIDPKLASPWNGLGNLLQNHLGRYEEAEEAYRKAIQINPQYASPWYGLGNLLKKHLGRYEEAEEAYRKAVQIDPKYASPWYGLGRFLQDHLE